MPELADLINNGQALGETAPGVFGGLDVLTETEASAIYAPRSSTLVDVLADHGSNSAALTAAAAAVTAAAATGPVTMLFRPGTYTTSTGLTLTGLSNVTIIGHAATISSSAGTTHVLKLLSCQKFSVSGLRLTHSATGARETAADGLNLVNCWQGNIRDVHVGYVRSVGIRVQASHEITVDGCSVTGSLADGITAYTDARVSGANGQITATSTTLYVPDGNMKLTADDIGSYVVIPGAGVAGATLVSTITAVTDQYTSTIAAAASTTVTTASVAYGRGCSDVRFTGNHVDTSGDDAYAVVAYNKWGATAWPATHQRIVISNNTARNVTVTGRGVAIVGCDGFTVTGNIIKSCATNGIQVEWAADSQACRNGVISGNVIVDNASASGNTAAISVASASSSYPVENITVVGNIVDGSLAPFMQIGGAAGATKNITVIGNRGRMVPDVGHGINVENVENVSLIGNSLDGAYLAGIITSGNTGSVRIEGNDVDNTDIGAGGFAGIYVQDATALVTGNNVLDGTGMNTAAVTTGRVVDNSPDTGSTTQPLSHSVMAGYMRPQLNTGGWNNVDINAGYLLGAFRYGNGNVNDEAGWDLPLLAGTWALTLVHRKDNNRGIYSVRIDGVEVGTTDGYAAAQADAASEITGVTVATAGVKRVSFKMATKNASSSAYYGGIQGFTLTRTGA